MICLSAGDTDLRRSGITGREDAISPSPLGEETCPGAYCRGIRSAEKFEVAKINGFREAFGLDPVRGTHGTGERAGICAAP